MFHNHILQCWNPVYMIKIWERPQTRWVALWSFSMSMSKTVFIGHKGLKVKTESCKYVGDIRFESVYCIDDACSCALHH